MKIYPSPLEVLIDLVALSEKNCKFAIQSRLDYATKENFIGRIIDGYSADAVDVCLMEKQAAHALCEVQNELNQSNLGLYVFDAYRPLRAVKDFAQWFSEPAANDYELERKRIHYPNIAKTDLAPLGYAPSTISKHNFGHVVDLTLINLKTNEFLDMGVCFDYFDELSHATATVEQMGQQAIENRDLLSHVMQKYGFKPYDKEYWHFEFHRQEVNEPMDIPITRELKNLNAS